MKHRGKKKSTDIRRSFLVKDTHAWPPRLQGAFSFYHMRRKITECWLTEAEGMITRCWLSLWFIDFNLTKWSRVTLSTRASYRKTLKIQVKSILKCPRAYFITYANRRVTVLSMLTEYRAIFLFVWFLGENNWYLDDSEWGLEKEHHSDSCVGWKLSKEKRRSQAHRRVLTIFFWEL